jgi:hypothetical protein
VSGSSTEQGPAIQAKLPGAQVGEIVAVLRETRAREALGKTEAARSRMGERKALAEAQDALDLRQLGKLGLHGRVGALAGFVALRKLDEAPAFFDLFVEQPRAESSGIELLHQLLEGIGIESAFQDEDQGAPRSKSATRKTSPNRLLMKSREAQSCGFGVPLAP